VSVDVVFDSFAGDVPGCSGVVAAFPPDFLAVVVGVTVVIFP